ncbi:DNA methyltransferase [Moraxella osloensis]|uniref:DNA methyltransferase n=1 Tax=Faucicola osloensis TaxID=34062 RepID=UPI00242DAF16|nr:site-specific DNA-methyltransferase [Moraxella osloensis]
MSHYATLNQKLQQMFQINRPDLDFGVYRILNARRDEISDYLNHRLKAKVEQYLSDTKKDVSGNQKDTLTARIKDEFGKRAFDEVGNLVDSDALASTDGQAYQALMAQSDNNFDEGQVYNHLATFFSRYYDEGDFISQRRYKGDTYAIPYSGEEVMLHWANKDQYYTKSSEMFSNYRIRFDDLGEFDKSLNFRLLSADTAKDNQKDNDKKRVFVILTEEKDVPYIDDDGEEQIKKVTPVELKDNGKELTIWFQYVALDSATKQEKINEDTHKKVLNNPIVTEDWRKLLEAPAPTEKDNKRDLFTKHLNNYTTKNTADYFIHKDLGKFLNNELDFYIKNEVMHLDDVVNSDSFAQIEKQLAIVKCVRLIGRELIGFLASLEDFQKRLWLKKKFVVYSHYCVTLDRVNADLYGEIADNAKQWAQWESLGLNTGEAGWGTAEYLVSHPFLMVDTSLFEVGFKAKLLREMADLDGQTDGVIIHSDNFQGLNLLQEKYKQQVNTVYIDPPYNSPKSQIIYKNTFKHSSFLSLLENRLSLSKDFNVPDGSHIIAIDKHEENGLFRLISQIFTENDNTLVTIEHNRKGVQGDHFSYTNEYAIFSISGELKNLNQIERDESNFEYSNFRNWGGESLRTDAANCFYAVLTDGKNIVGFGDVWTDLNKHPISANVENNGLIEIYPIDNSGVERKWRYERKTVEGIVKKLRVKNDKHGVLGIEIAKTTDQFKTVWYSPKYNAGDNGTAVLSGLGLKFDNPKSLYTVQDCIFAVSNKDALIFDYFGGSGTTAHSIINMNRDDNGNRKYILIEQGEYFNTVIKPRIQKVIYSENWKDGKPALPKDTKTVNEANRYNGISHCLKVIKLESYEDTLNNLELRRTGQQQQLFDSMNDAQKDDYLMHYLLDIESKGSLLSVADFAKPFDYQLKITSDSAGAYTNQPIDLVDTFNYLIGLNVQHIDYQLERGYVFIEGTLRTGEKTLVFWRDTSVIGYDKLEKTLLEKLKVNPKDREYQLIYLNGDHNIPSPFIHTEDGERKLKIRSIEQTFFDKMFIS